MFFKKPPAPAGAQPTILTLKNEIAELRSTIKDDAGYRSVVRSLREDVRQLSELVDTQGQQIAALKLDLEELNRRQQSPAPQPPKRPTKKKIEGQ